MTQAMTEQRMLWRHKKRGTVYEIISTTAALQCATAQEVEDQFAGQAWTVYRNIQTKAVYVRPSAEFQDGRFEPITSYLASQAGETLSQFDLTLRLNRSVKWLRGQGNLVIWKGEMWAQMRHSSSGRCAGYKLVTLNPVSPAPVPPSLGEHITTSADPRDELERALGFLLEKRVGSTVVGCASCLQQKLQCGFNRAMTLLDEMVAAGWITEADLNGARRILVPLSPTGRVLTPLKDL